MATAADGTEAKQTQDSLKQCLLSALSTGQAEPPTRPHARTKTKTPQVIFCAI